MEKLKSLIKGKSMEISIPINGSGSLMIPKELRKTDAYDLNPDALTEDSRYMIADNMLINPEDIKQAYFIDVAKKLGVVVDNKEDAKRNTNAMFYIENKEKEATQSLSEIQKQIKTQNIIMELSHDKKIELAALLGFSGKELTLTQLTANLHKIASAKPYENTNNYQTILSLLEDPDYNYKVLLSYLIFDGIIRKDNNGYFYNDSFLGSDKSIVIEFMKNKDNSGVTDQWKYKYLEKEKSSKAKK